MGRKKRGGDSETEKEREVGREKTENRGRDEGHRKDREGERERERREEMKMREEVREEKSLKSCASKNTKKRSSIGEKAPFTWQKNYGFQNKKSNSEALFSVFFSPKFCQKRVISVPTRLIFEANQETPRRVEVSTSRLCSRSFPGCQLRFLYHRSCSSAYVCHSCPVRFLLLSNLADGTILLHAHDGPILRFPTTIAPAPCFTNHLDWTSTSMLGPRHR